MRPPLRPATPPNRAGCRTTYSSARQAPWENPPSRIFVPSMPADSTCATRSPTTPSADDSQGSFDAIGAMNRFGYHVFPAACGASHATPSPRKASRELEDVLRPAHPGHAAECRRLARDRAARQPGAPGRPGAVRWTSPASPSERAYLHRPHRRGDRLQLRLDLTAMPLQPRRQHQPLPQRLDRLVRGEPGAERRELDDVAVGIAGVDALEVDAIHDRRHAQPGTHEALPPRELFLFVLHRERKVMCLSGADARPQRVLVLPLEVRDERARASVLVTPVPVRLIRVVEVRRLSSRAACRGRRYRRHRSRGCPTPMAVMWCMPAISAMSGVIDGTGSGHVFARMASSSRCPLTSGSAGAMNDWPSASAALIDRPARTERRDFENEPSGSLK